MVRSASGQISLGKEFAGRTVLIDNTEPGVWIIKTASTIPEDELWLHQQDQAQRLDRAMTHMDQAAAITDVDELESQLNLS